MGPILAGCLGDDVLELGPGFGATTRVLANLTPSLTALEIDGGSACLLERRPGSRVRILHGDATQIPAHPLRGHFGHG
ncbi:rRNA adenine N-6-methyltransferase family protein [Frankia tisae]|uniref:rRNA adenine N-6-methyltransferase family protein n=1 Tax=Frankia tisae TaxID=2950104 RepID=UPI0021C19C6A|nr:rRNA adenine N-6-methyltransferase family protein [Frankia tisae]